MMPKRLVFVRHGESEGNVIAELMKAGRYAEVSPEVRAIPGWKWRLTSRGREQATAAGQWITCNIPGFDWGYTSCYPRALETAGLLGLPGSIWRVVYYIRERGWGEIESFPQRDEDVAMVMEELRRRREDRVFWCPPSGETLADVIHRIDRFFDTLHRECSEDSVIAVMHGEAMWAARLILERILPREAELMMNDRANDIGNCHILEYSRLNPHTGEELTRLEWMRSINPLEPDKMCNWRQIERRFFTGEELLAEAELFPSCSCH